MANLNVLSQKSGQSGCQTRVRRTIEYRNHEHIDQKETITIFYGSISKVGHWFTNEHALWYATKSTRGMVSPLHNPGLKTSAESDFILDKRRPT